MLSRNQSTATCFRLLRWFKLAHISIQVSTFHDGCKQGIDQQIFNRKSISRKITHPQSLFGIVYCQYSAVYTKMFNFRRITLFCLEKRLSKHKWLYFLKIWGEAWHLWPSWLRLCFGPPRKFSAYATGQVNRDFILRVLTETSSTLDVLLQYLKLINCSNCYLIC